MTDTTETITIRGDGISVALLVWRRWHKPMPGLAESILALNPGLADLGPVIPYGTVVVMPVPQQAEAQTVAAKVRLW